ncbi:MAG: molybdenum ABC transporter ATP-binding protein [Oxalobacteraceae bacterium]|nr:molybdenum ABC transporter ATP-binding protein [Oxalobacteraceae bacterium]
MSLRLKFTLTRADFALHVDLQLPGRGVTALFGPSGCGKTTLLRCIAGLERASGSLMVNEHLWQDATHFTPTHQRAIGYVFQEASLFPHLSVRGNLQYGMKRASRNGNVAIDPIIDLLGIRALLDRKPEGLSGGERQRVAIARALAVDPQLLLMDEPLAALDLKRKQEILPYLDRLQATLEIPILYVTHSPDEVVRLAHHLVVMDAGSVVASGELADTLSQLDLPVKLGQEAGVVIDSVVGSIESQWHLTRMDFDGGSVWIRDPGLALGAKARVRILASDVSLAREQPGKSSIQNVLQGQIDGMRDDEHPGLVLVRVKIGETALLARVTKRAVSELALKTGDTVWTQVKSVALAR